jgi:hypothetical protein
VGFWRKDFFDGMTKQGRQKGGFVYLWLGKIKFNRGLARELLLNGALPSEK